MITINNGNYSVDTDDMRNIAESVCKYLSLSGDITVKLGNEREAKELNRKFRKKDYATDVLSFPFNEQLEDSFYIGDIFICYPVAEKQAEENSIPTENEIRILMIHGLLHLAGYDHENDNGEMMKMQNTFVKKFNL